MRNNRCRYGALVFCPLWALLVVGSSLATEPQGSGASRDWHASVRQFALEHFHHPAWGFSHSVRDYELARELARQDKVSLDDDIIYAAAYLHDMAAFAPWDREKEGIDHADDCLNHLPDLGWTLRTFIRRSAGRNASTKAL